MTRRRKLSHEEEDLWRMVAQTARPMHSNAADILSHLENTQTPTPVRTPVAPQKPALKRLKLGSQAPQPPALSMDLMPSIGETLAAQPLRMDAKQHGRMVRGKLIPESRIDLHGMTLAEAHPELIRFVTDAYARGLRLILVITGKGKVKPDHGPIPQRVGALRHQVPQWLRLPPLSPLILQVAEAHRSHGGSGAFYIYLRRR